MKGRVSFKKERGSSTSVCVARRYIGCVSPAWVPENGYVIYNAHNQILRWAATEEEGLSYLLSWFEQTPQ
jgi:hypothetical protein